MKSLLLSMALCAMSVTTYATEAERDTIDCYIIDNQKVESFAGAHIVGKSVSSYEIAYQEVKGVVEKHHIIKTDNQRGVILIRKNNASQSPDPLIVVDGKEMSNEAFSKIKPEDIDNITVLKPDSKAATELYGKKGEAGVILVTTKEYKNNKK